MLSTLSPSDREIIWRCLRVAASGPFFDDAEFHALFGLHRSTLQSIVDSGCDAAAPDETLALAINNSRANLIGYPHGLSLREHVGLDVDELQELFDRWRASIAPATREPS
jgi:hypothetical protein